MTDRLLIVGWDGADWDILDDFVAGDLPLSSASWSRRAPVASFGARCPTTRGRRGRRSSPA